MASWNHEGIVELFRQEPRLAPELLESSLGVAVPHFSDARVEAANMTELKPAELHADLVVTLRQEDRPVLGIVVEVPSPLTRNDPVLLGRSGPGLIRRA